MNKMKLKKKYKLKFKYKIFFFIFVVFTTITFKYLKSKNINYDNKKITSYLLKSSNIKTKSKNDFKLNILDVFNINYIDNNKKITEKEIKKEINNNYLVYIYNTHENEEYQASGLIDNSINPTVSINNYIIKDYLEQKNINTLVEDKSVSDALNVNNFKYAKSYEITRMFMEDAKNAYPSLKYYIDIHRDSLPKDKTTVIINGKSYAKVLFLIGLENNNYLQNLAFTEIINNKLNDKYNGLSKGILKKGGEGVNGVYNQDFSMYTILIEIGGNENTIEEVMNTSLAISDVLSEVINENEKQNQ